MEDKLFTLLVEQEDVTWKDIIYDLVKTEQLDPWDVDITKLTQRYIEIIKELKKADFKVSGKVVLAAALMLNIKGNRLVGEDLDALDRLIASKDINEDEFYEELEGASFRDPSEIPDSERMQLVPRTPQPRMRKVSVFDLVAALEKALEVKKRRLLRELPATELIMPRKSHRDITLMIKGLYKHILDLLSSNGGRPLKFSHLTPNATKEDKIYTFIPLLHLTNERKIDLHQPEHFGDFRIALIDRSKVKGDIMVQDEVVAADPLKEYKDAAREARKEKRKQESIANGEPIKKPRKAKKVVVEGDKLKAKIENVGEEAKPEPAKEAAPVAPAPSPQ